MGSYLEVFGWGHPLNETKGVQNPRFWITRQAAETIYIHQARTTPKGEWPIYCGLP